MLRPVGSCPGRPERLCGVGQFFGFRPLKAPVNGLGASCDALAWLRPTLSAFAPCLDRSMGCLDRSMGCLDRSMGCCRRSMGCCRDGKACIFLFRRLDFPTIRPVVWLFRPLWQALAPCFRLLEKRNGRRTGDFGGQLVANGRRRGVQISPRVGKKLNAACGREGAGASKTRGGHFLAQIWPLVSFSVGRPPASPPAAAARGSARLCGRGRRGARGRFLHARPAFIKNGRPCQRIIC